MRFVTFSWIPVTLLGLVIALGTAPTRAEPVEVTVTPIALFADDPGRETVGRLRYRGGLHIASGHQRFGGFSGLGVSADGRRMLSVSDGGMSFSAELTYDGDGRLSGLARADLGALADTDGTPLAAKRWADAEAMSPGVEGEIIVAFERAHRLWRYDPGVTAPRALRPPRELADMDANDGIESLTLLNDGRLFAIAEGSPDEDARVAWVSRRAGWDVLIYRTEGGFRPTGAATLPGGDVLVLERYFTVRSGVRIRVMRVDAASIAPGADIAGQEIALLAPPASVDNFEGIEVRRGPEGETLIYLISDDNFSRDQRTLLLMFAYADG